MGKTGNFLDGPPRRERRRSKYLASRLGSVASGGAEVRRLPRCCVPSLSRQCGEGERRGFGNGRVGGCGWACWAGWVWLTLAARRHDRSVASWVEGRRAMMRGVISAMMLGVASAGPATPPALPAGMVVGKMQELNLQQVRAHPVDQRVRGSGMSACLADDRAARGAVRAAGRRRRRLSHCSRDDRPFRAPRFRHQTLAPASQQTCVNGGAWTPTIANPHVARVCRFLRVGRNQQRCPPH